MSTAENKAIVRRAIDEIWNAHDLGAVDDLYAADFVNHDPLAPEVTGLEAFKAWVSGIFDSFPDIHVAIDNMVAEGGKVAKVHTLTATHTGELMGVPPTGKPVTMMGISIYRIAGGKIAEMTWSYNMLGTMIQIGAIPAPG
jgi:steroid delta-isomerase-like uncharacterized protein